MLSLTNTFALQKHHCYPFIHFVVEICGKLCPVCVLYGGKGTGGFHSVEQFQGENPNSLCNIYSQDIPKGRPGTFQERGENTVEHECYVISWSDPAVLISER